MSFVGQPIPGMKVLVVILCTLVNECLSQGYSYCTPPQWEGYEGTIGAIYQNGTSTVVDSFSWLSYDLNNTRMAMFTSGSTGGVPYKRDFIYDYPKGILYTIEADKCTKAPLSGPFQKQCTPKDAVMVWGKTWLGGAGPNEVLWILGFVGKQGAIDYHMSFNQFPLVPVFETLTGEINGDPFFQTSNFMNITLGIKDPSVFIPPASCNGVSLQLNANTRHRRFGILAD